MPRRVTPFTLKEGALVPNYPYQLVRLLGKGGFGQVWHAINPETDESFALKFCLNADTGFDSLRNEARHLARIKKACESLEGFVKLHQLYYNAKPFPFVAYEYIEAEDFSVFLGRRYKKTKKESFSPFEAAEIVHALATIMARVHTMKTPIVHRDLKPSNILVLNNKPPWMFKIMDFGIGVVAVNTTRAGQMPLSDPGQRMAGIGTFCYMSSEQCDDTHKPHPSDDVHALGVIWYELLRGELFVFRHSGPPSHDPDDFDWNGLRRKLAKRGLTRDQAALVESCLHAHDDRPQHAGILAEEIRKLFPLIRESILSDVVEIERVRISGGDWLTHVKMIAKKQLGTWDEGVLNDIPEAYWLKGICYQCGIGSEPTQPNSLMDRLRERLRPQATPTTDPDLDKARECFEWAADRDCPNAKCDLGILCLADQRERAICLLKEAAEKNHAEATFRLGEMLAEVRAIDALPFVPSGDSTATSVSAMMNVDGSLSSVTVGDLSGASSVADLFTFPKAMMPLPTIAAPVNPNLPPSWERSQLKLPLSLSRGGIALLSETFTVGGSTPSNILPIRLLLSSRITDPMLRYLLDLSPSIIKQLEAKELFTLQRILYSSEEWMRLCCADGLWDAVRMKLAEFWVDPWEICRKKSEEFLEKARELMHVGVVKALPPSGNSLVARLRASAKDHGVKQHLPK